LDPSTIQGTGVGGRITREDVLAVIDARATGAAAPTAPAPAAPAPAPAPAPAATAPAPARQVPSVPPVVPGSGDRVEQLNNIRRLTGEAMVASKQTAPHVITAVEVDFERVEIGRASCRERVDVAGGRG